VAAAVQLEPLAALLAQLPEQELLGTPPELPRVVLMLPIDLEPGRALAREPPPIGQEPERSLRLPFSTCIRSVPRSITER